MKTTECSCAELDVERLAMAMRQAWPHHMEGSASIPASDSDRMWPVADPALPSGRLAEVIAREYAALSCSCEDDPAAETDY